MFDALFGRRARRFSLGATIPDGPLAIASRHALVQLSELEQMMVLTAAAGNTGWQYMITRHARYAPHLSNYSAAGGRTFPSSAGSHTSEVFFTDDDGVYFFATRDAPSLVEHEADERLDMETVLAAHRKRIRKLGNGRLYIPAEKPFMEGHNTWCANLPGSTLIIPVGDTAQHLLLMLCFLVQNGYCIYDDVNRQRIGGLEHFPQLVDADQPLPLTFIEQYALTELTAELSIACFAGMLMLQAIGLGGWCSTALTGIRCWARAATRACPASVFDMTPMRQERSFL